jgi:hypothetical protein
MEDATNNNLKEGSYRNNDFFSLSLSFSPGLVQIRKNGTVKRLLAAATPGSVAVVVVVCLFFAQIDCANRRASFLPFV